MKSTLLACILFTLIGTAAVQPASAQTRLKNYMKSDRGASLCLAVKDGRIANDSPLITWDCIPGDPSQTFQIRGSNMYIGAPGSPYCMASYDNPPHRGSRVGVWQCQPGDPTQSFNFGASANIQGPNQLCVGVNQASNVRGSAMILWDCQNLTSIVAPNQAWVSEMNLLPGTHFYDRTNTELSLTALRALPTRNGILVDGSGKPLTISYRVISNDGGTLVASGAGNLVASGAGNLVGNDGSSLLATANGFNLYNPNAINAALARITNANVSSIATNQGANISSIATNQGANIYGLNAYKDVGAASAGRLSVTILGPATYLKNVANTVKWQYSGTPAANQSIVFLYLVANGSKYVLASNIPIATKQATIRGANWAFAGLPGYRCSLVIGDITGNVLAEMPVTVR